MRRAILLLLTLATLLGAVPALSQTPAVSVTLDLTPEVRPVVLAPGFITTLRFNWRVTHAAVGDPGLVSLEQGGWMGRDVVLRPNRGSGQTNLHIWVGEVVTLWQVVISTEVPRTPELVLVRVRGRLSPPERLPTVEARGGEQVLTAELAEGGVTASFSAERTRTGIAVRYRLRNTGERAYRLSPALSVVWADGKVVPFTLLRQIGGVEPSVILPGGVESGVFSIMRPARTLRVLIPLYPDVPGRALPVWFEPIFAGLDRLQLPQER